MQALPGRASRAPSGVPPASVTRTSAHADQRRRLLRAVGELVAERGYSDVTVELIVRRAHVSYKTFYKHYRSKEECFVALFETVLGKIEEKIREQLDRGDLSWSEEVVLALRTLVDAIVAEPVIARAVIVESLTVGPAIATRYEQGTRAFASLLRRGRELNPRGEELPETVEDTLAGSIIWSAYERLLVGHADELSEYLPVLLELVLRTYLGPDEARRIARAETPGLEPVLV